MAQARDFSANVLIASLVSVTLFAGSPLLAQREAQPVAMAMGEAMAALLEKDAPGFASTNAPWQFTFPSDHGAHPDHRTESWHFSGSLLSREGRRFGFQLAFFRIAVTPLAAPIGPSAWATREVYWAQFALGDAAANRSYEFERVERAAMGLSGSEPSPARVWVGDWIMEVGPPTQTTRRSPCALRIWTCASHCRCAVPGPRSFPLEVTDAAPALTRPIASTPI